MSAKDVEKVVKKQKSCTSTTHELIDKMMDDISATRKALSEPSTSEQQVLSDLSSRIRSQNYVGKVTDEQKELYNAVSKLGKVLDKQFLSDISAACRDDTFDRATLNKIVCEHLYREGHFDLGDAFSLDAAIPAAPAAALKAPYVEMHATLEAMGRGDLGGALGWAERNRDRLGSYHHLEFMLRRLEFIRLLQLTPSEGGGRGAAVSYAQRHLAPFCQTHMSDIKRLMGCLLFAPRLGKSPYADLVAPQRWQEARAEFVRACCSLLGQSHESPLLVATAAGAVVLPQLLKLANIMKLEDLKKCADIPVELELGREYVFHSIFACPVSREQATLPDNPPTMLPCGHVLCKQSVQRIASRENRLFKCPYCPGEALLVQCRPITFPDCEDEQIREYRLMKGGEGEGAEGDEGATQGKQGVGRGAGAAGGAGQEMEDDDDLLEI